MNPRVLTASETAARLHASLRDYIEAAYHVGDAGLVEQRRHLLEAPGVIRQEPYLESTPRYTTGRRFADLDIPEPAKRAIAAVTSEAVGADGERLRRRLYDPPFTHQAEALVKALRDGRSLVVTTGTGSGKTESFLMPILGALARQAADGAPFQDHAVRAVLLYPMNALVNDQLGRLRLLLGDPRVRELFQGWAGRPARFARYTSRTLYPGVRTAKKDQRRLAPLKEFYVDTLRAARNPDAQHHQAKKTLYDELRRRGKWPAKPDLDLWWGADNSRWSDADGDPARCVTLPDDSELLTRHEVLAAPPDVLVTNYSMLEYMMMRPVERPVFERTRQWLADYPDERLLLVVDEAHLYRGASGAEVALLLRRLQERLRIDESRLQVILTSASFGKKENAETFAADLTGLPADRFDVVTGTLYDRPAPAPGSPDAVDLLVGLDLEAFYASDPAARRDAVQPFLDARGVTADLPVEEALYRALETYPPLSLLVNRSMREALAVRELGPLVFPDAEQEAAERAVTALIALGTAAREDPDAPGLLPCRVHMFFRGLPGLWACLDPGCTELDEALRGGPTGTLYGQPRQTCECGARVYELYTCRSCGTAHARAHVDDPERPTYLWAEAGEAFRLGDARVESLAPLDLLLETPDAEADTEPVEVDLVTGRVNVRGAARSRRVWLTPERARRPLADGKRPPIEPGQFERCAVCDATAAFGRSPVQDHQTKGDQPFQALVTEQVAVQPPSTRERTDFAPLQGRKTLIFSDSRQLAARMAPVVQTLSTRDALRPLLVVGYDLLQRHDVTRPFVSLDHVYTAVLLAAAHLGVRLRPPQTSRESFHSPEIEDAVQSGVLDDPTGLALLLSETRRPPQALAKDLHDALAHRYYGLRPLGLATVREKDKHTAALAALPNITGLAETNDQKVAVARLWLQQWLPDGLHLSILDAAALDLSTGTGMTRPFQKWLGDHKTNFNALWRGPLLEAFGDQKAPGKFWLRGTYLTLDTGGPWAYCDRCRTTQRPVPGCGRCVQCGADDVVRAVDPDEDVVFVARKGYYRSTTTAARQDDPPMALLAAEHTAQLNAVREGEVYSEAERHELLFQDVDLGPDDQGRRRYALDVLSCTTTMEVGIDIGSLSGVALRNLPPARSNYQQRAGRAGRRGNAVATVVAFGSADSHDEHYFSQPAEMIRGAVVDPALTLSNRDITRRHLTAYLLQRYFHEEFPVVSPDDPANHSLFAALGPVDQFLGDDPDGLTLTNFDAWLRRNEGALRTDVDRWLPAALGPDDRNDLLAGIVGDTVGILALALDVQSEPDLPAPSSADEPAPTADTVPTDSAPEDAPAEEEATATVETDDSEQGGRRAAQTNLLDRLLYEGVLPKYAFPTDVAGFHVFDPNRSTPFRPAFEYVPQQGLTSALSQYAPGKQLYIGNRRWTSGALYDAHPGSLYAATSAHESYVECERCGYAEVCPSSNGHAPDCPACGDPFSPSRRWIRPPGFAHPIYLDPDTTPDAPFSQSYATRAKLAAPVRDGADAVPESVVNDRVSTWSVRDHLLVTNRGPEQMGYHLCVKCGRIERSAQAHTDLAAPHEKPYPHRERECPGFLWRGVVLGTTFVSDVLLLGFRLDPEVGVVLPPGSLGTEVALRTVSEALALAACDVLQLEPGEIEAEFRPAVAPTVQDEGAEVEVYLYDTLPGGAGFSHRAGERISEVLDRALDRLDDCPEDCDASCYRCLRRFTNRFEHGRLDRHVGADLLRYLLHGTLPTLSGDRQRRATGALADDLRRALGPGGSVERDVVRDVPGVGAVRVPLVVTSGGATVLVAIASPVAPAVPPTPDLREASEVSLDAPVRLIDEMIVRKNLPHATDLVRGWVRSGP